MKKYIFKNLTIILGLTLNLTQTHAALIFNNEADGTHESTFFLDSADVSTDFIDLEFGTSNTAKLRFDIINDKFLLNRNLDLGDKEALNFRFENLAIAPICDLTVKGKNYFNTTDNLSYYCNGTLWKENGGGVGGSGKFIDGTDTNNAVYTLGNVGINTLVPSQKLDVRGNINIQSGALITTTETFEGVTFPPAPWTIGGNINWLKSTTVFQEGLASAESGNILDNQTSFIDRNYTFSGNGELRFFWKVSSEAAYDFLLFCLDNDVCTRTTGFNQRISGNINWVEVVVPITAGAHSFRWVYAKDGSVSNGTDNGYIDNVRFIEGGADGNIYISNKIGIGITNPTNPIEHSSGANLTTGGVWTNASDKNLKENFEAINSQEILKKISELPISKWNYKTERSDIKHIGPMAQDFYKAFRLGDSEKTISTIDEPSVALIGIQALYEKIKVLETKIENLEKPKLSFEN